MKSKAIISLLLITILFTIPIKNAGAQENDITITDLGTLGGIVSMANGINDRGQVVGMSYIEINPYWHAFLWSEENGMTDLGTLGGDYSEAFSINNSGQVVGASYTTAGVNHAFLWSEETGMMDLHARWGL